MKRTVPKQSGTCPECGSRLEYDPRRDQPLSCPNCDAALSPSDLTDPLVGQTLGEFEIVEFIGRGGMGVVYKARQPSLGRFVAIKILPEDRAHDAKSLGRFDREAHAAAALRHPNIVDIHSVGEDRGYHYIAMELVDGESLADIVKRDGPLPADPALAIMKQVAAALAEAHAGGILHRDIKPSNILLTRRGRVKVADFGLAKRPEADVNVTQTGKLVGSPHYMPPELASGKPLDARSDLYSLGATLYHVLAGQPPFRGGTSIEIAIKHVEEQPRPLREVAPSVPRSLVRLIHRLLNKDPADRPASAEELLRELRHVATAPDGTLGDLVEALEHTQAPRAAPRARPPRRAPVPSAVPPTREIPVANKLKPSKALIAAVVAGAALLIAIPILVVVVLRSKEEVPREAPAQPEHPAPPAWRIAWEQTQANADRLVEQHQYGQALGEYQAFAARFNAPGPQKLAQDGMSEAQADAAAAWAGDKRLARQFLANKQYAQARAALQPAITQYGIPPYKQEAGKLLAEIWDLTWKDAEGKAQTHVREERFGQALQTYRSLAQRFKDPKLQEQTGKAIRNVQKQADAAYRQAERLATKLLAENEFEQARRALRPPVQVYGIGDLKKKAEELLVKIGVAEEAWRKRPPPPPPREDEQQRFAAAVKLASMKLGAWDFAGAAAALAKLKLQDKYLSARLATHDDEIDRLGKLKGKLIKAITGKNPWLDQVVIGAKTVRGRQVVRADGKGITVRAVARGTETTDVRPWGSLDGRTLKLVIDKTLVQKGADDWLGLGILFMWRKDFKTAWTNLDKARKLGAKIDRYLDPLAAAAFAEAKKLLDAKKFTEADAALASLAEKYAKTRWLASHRKDFDAARTQAKADIADAEAEKLYAQAFEFYKSKAPASLWDLKIAVEKLQRDYPKTPAVTDVSRKPSFAEMAKAVADGKLGKFLTVRKDGKGDFKGIQAAIDAAPPRSLIEIQDDGPYNEKVVIAKERKGLTLRGRKAEKGKKGCWPVIHSAKGGPKIDVLVTLAPATMDVTLERIVLAHVAPTGTVQHCVAVQQGGTVLLRSAIVCMRGGEVLGGKQFTCSVTNSFIAGRAEEQHSAATLALADSIWVGAEVLMPRLRASNCLLHVGSVGHHNVSLRHCTVTGVVRVGPGTSALMDSIFPTVTLTSPRALSVLHCDIVGMDVRGFRSLKSKPYVTFERNFNKDPMFRDPRNLDFRLKDKSPCKGRASDGGDVGVRYTPEMIEILNKALELRKKGIIKF